MLKIGLIDFYLNNWHTDHYPEYMALAAQRYGMDIAITDACALRQAPEGAVSNEAWCRQRGICLARDEQELIARVDGIMVMGADECLEHELLARQALMSGKPVYCDKTFAPNLETAVRMFDLAKAHRTPLFSCSAQRYVMELQSWRCLHQGRNAAFCATQGPGDLRNYSIHQFEMVEYIMGRGAAQCLAFDDGVKRTFQYRYEDGRAAQLEQATTLPFRMTVSDGAQSRDIAVTDYYMALMYALCRFFQDGIPPVSREDTLEIMAMQQAARMALETPGKWIAVPAYQ